MAANLSSGNQQAYDEPGIRILKGLRPDVALLQEFNYRDNSPEAIRSFIDQAFGAEYHYYREDVDAQEAAARAIPNGIVSRYPFALNAEGKPDVGEWQDEDMPNRDFAWAKIQVPVEGQNPVAVYAVSVHLKAGSSSRDRKRREGEARELAKQIEAHFPKGALIAVGGDFNTGRGPLEAGELLDQDPNFTSDAKVFQALEALVRQDPTRRPRDTNGGIGTNRNGRSPYDWVLVSSTLEAYEAPVVLKAQTAELREGSSVEFPHGLIFRTDSFDRPETDFNELELVAPAQAGDSVAEGMQHMGVVRQFLIK